MVEKSTNLENDPHVQSRMDIYFRDRLEVSTQKLIDAIETQSKENAFVAFSSFKHSLERYVVRFPKEEVLELKNKKWK